MMKDGSHLVRWALFTMLDAKEQFSGKGGLYLSIQGEDRLNHLRAVSVPSLVSKRDLHRSVKIYIKCLCMCEENGMPTI